MRQQVSLADIGDHALGMEGVTNLQPATTGGAKTEINPLSGGILVKRILRQPQHGMGAGGGNNGLEIGISGTATPRVSLDELSQEARDSIGFLRLNGAERLFAIDGQHRLSGIKHAIASGHALADELVPVIFVGHANTQVGMRRTRRLFTTLNKTAVAVSKRDIIALDEDDVMAITARDLYETDVRFAKPRIAIITTNNLPQTATALTTIGNLYDVLKLIFMHESGLSRDITLRFNRPSDDRLKLYHDTADSFFSALAAHFPPLKEYYRSKDPAATARKYRSSAGGHILFRPIGLELITRATIAMAKERKIAVADAVRVLSRIETDLTKSPYAGVIWNRDRGTVISKGKSLAARLVFYMLRLRCREPTLLLDLKVFLGLDKEDSTVTLPPRVV